MGRLPGSRGGTSLNLPISTQQGMARETVASHQSCSSLRSPGDGRRGGLLPCLLPWVHGSPPFSFYPWMQDSSDKIGCLTSCSSKGVGCAELGGAAEASRCLTCTSALRLQSITRIELLDERVPMLPADNAVEKTDLFQQGPCGLPGPTGQSLFLSLETPTLCSGCPWNFSPLTDSAFTMAVPFLRFNLCW